MKIKDQNTYRPDIDGLRALAVLSVIGFHGFPNWVKGGFIGVDVFFVISGYLITQIILKDMNNNTFTYWNFYARRILRIFPALIAVLIPTFLFGWYILLPDEFVQLTRHIAGGSAFVSNFVLLGENGYFDNAAETKPLLHLWSLGVEQQYYLVWPIMLVFLLKRSKESLFLIFALSIVASIWLTFTNPSFAFYMLPTRFWELMAGGFLSYATLNKPDAFGKASNVLSVSGLILVGLGLFMLNKTLPFPGYFAALPVAGAVLIIAAGMQSKINALLLGNPIMAWIGLISYPLYLWHWPLLVYAKIANGDLLTIKERLVLIAIAFVLAALTFYLIEKPLRRNRSERNAKILLAGMIALCGITVVMSIIKFPPRHNVEGVTKLLEAAYDWDFPGVTAKRLLLPNLRIFTYESAHPQQVVYLGDSNLEQYGPRIAKVVNEHPHQYKTAVLIGNQNDCNVVAEIFEPGDCSAALTATDAYLKLHDVEAVVLVVAGSKYLTNMAKPENRARMEAFITEQKKIRDVYIVLNIPEGASVNPKEMFTGDRLGNLRAKDISDVRFDYAGFMKKYEITRELVTQLGAKTGARVIDPLMYLCPEQICPVFDKTGNPLYKDTAHIRPFYAREAAEYIDIPLKME